jgi:hypothetical protein
MSMGGEWREGEEGDRIKEEDGRQDERRTQQSHSPVASPSAPIYLQYTEHHQDAHNQQGRTAFF